MLIASTALAAGACGGSRPTPAGYAGDDARAFVRENRAELENEIAVGSGPRIYDLAILADCQDVAELSRRLHQRQGDFFSSAPERNTTEAGQGGRAGVSDEEAAERIVRFMQERREFRCQNLDLSRQREFAAGRRHVGPRRSITTARGGTP